MSFSAYVAAIEAEISHTNFGLFPDELYEPLRYIMKLGGKRMRPCLTLMAANLYDQNWQKHIKPALAVEVFHNFSLMHDDIMDQADLRRGQETVHKKWNVNTAILSGDVMLVEAYNLFDEVENAVYKKIIQRFNKTAAEVCEGQQLDMVFAERATVSKAEYLEMIKLKTSVLLGFAMELGGRLNAVSESEIDLLYAIGLNTGMGFQMHDDLLDLYGDPLKFGKKIGGDIIENKKTWMMLDALEKDSAAVTELIENQDENQKVSMAQDLFRSLGVKQNAETLADSYFQKAENAVSTLSITDAKKEILNQFIQQIKNRES